jgi:hypothetical protein
MTRFDWREAARAAAVSGWTVAAGVLVVTAIALVLGVT